MGESGCEKDHLRGNIDPNVVEPESSLYTLGCSAEVGVGGVLQYRWLMCWSRRMLRSGVGLSGRPTGLCESESLVTAFSIIESGDSREEDVRGDILPVQSRFKPE